MEELQNEIHQKLSAAVVNMEEEEASRLSTQVVESGLDAYQAIDCGLARGMEQAGVLFEEEEYFIPELLMCSDAMYAGLNVLKPHIKTAEQDEKYRVVLGVIQGDTHDIGKNLVKIMLESSGFMVFDLGRDIPPEQFVEAALEHDAHIIGLSTLMTTTMNGMREVINILGSRNLRERFKVMIGGGPISQAFAGKIGADGYSKNAAEAVRLAKKLCEENASGSIGARISYK